MAIPDDYKSVESDNPVKGTDAEQDSSSVDQIEDTASYNIAWSKTLIQTLEQTTKKSAVLMHRVRSFHETRKMLDVSKKMSENSSAQVNRARSVRSIKKE